MIEMGIGMSGRFAWRPLPALALLLGLGLVAGNATERSALPTTAHHDAPARKGIRSLPLAVEGIISATLGGDNPAYTVRASRGGFQAASPAQRMKLRFGRSGVRIGSGGVEVGLSLRAVGYGKSLRPVEPAAPSVEGNRLIYAHAGLSEWYANGPFGLEQGFTIPRAPSDHLNGPLTLSVALSGNARASLTYGRQSLTLSREGGRSLRYGGLIITDASGRRLHGWFELRAGGMLVRVDSRGANYPVRIDPFIQLGPKLTGGIASATNFGRSVALSADGNTLLVGGPFDNAGDGAVWVFTRHDGTWAQQGGRLVADCTSGCSGNQGTGESPNGGFGTGVALSADGSTALIGAARDGNDTGAAWVFTRSRGIWRQQGDKLTPSCMNSCGKYGINGDELGESVALSSDGNTALVGAPHDQVGVGAAWIFVRSAGVWTQQGEKLFGDACPEPATCGTSFGRSVALSSDGNTALIGAPYDDGAVGASWVFTRSGGTWTPHGEKLVGNCTSNCSGGEGTGEIGEGRVGESVALSADGNTALMGAPEDNQYLGAAWVFARLGGGWTQQGTKLSDGRERGCFCFFGGSVALSADGDTALIGAPSEDTFAGAAWVFRRLGGVWTQKGTRLIGHCTSSCAGGEGTGEIGEGLFGDRVALSADAKTGLIGAPQDDQYLGAAWVFADVPPPSVEDVSPSKGTEDGHVSVTITGTNFTGATLVNFGSTPALRSTVNSTQSITAVSPPEAAGGVDVTVTTPAGTSGISSEDRFTFKPPR